MGFVAEFRVEIPPVVAASRAVPDVWFSGEDVVLGDGNAHKFLVAAHGDRFRALEAALDGDPTVAEYVHLWHREGTAYYSVTYDEAADTRGTYQVAVEADIAYTDVRLQDGEYRIRARSPDRDALATLRDDCRERDTPFRPERLQEAAEGESSAVAALTESQREALAHERGYFATPRRWRWRTSPTNWASLDRPSPSGYAAVTSACSPRRSSDLGATTAARRGSFLATTFVPVGAGPGGAGG